MIDRKTCAIIRVLLYLRVLSTYTVNERTFQKANNSLKKNLFHFIGLMKYSNFC